ncbi:MAG: response regulator, partial [Desulfobulbaceae bacterium]|nr:response regulator [Desulfobulbaceae bacterium]
SQVHQLIMNLSTNAAQAMGSEYGKLTISLKGKNIQHSKESGYPHLKPGNYVELIVADTGQGITHEDKERIFEPFFTTKDVGEGTGLGLAVVHGIVENMQGDVSVESTHGVGSAFRVLLPLVVDVPQEMENNVVNTPIPVGKEKILLVDDEEELVKLGDQLLSNLGYQVRTVTNSQEALEIFTHNQNFDLVITDQTMPNLTGMELAKKILEMRPDIPILLCTGYSTEITDEKIREIGIRSVLMKPISIGDVSRVIRKELDGQNELRIKNEE